MKELFSKSFFGPLLICLSIFTFFLISLVGGKIPIPADSLLGLYHPWRDVPFDGYLQGKFPIKNPIATDPILQTYPWRKLSIENIKKGYLPLWNPYNFLGYPLLANSQSSPFQISNILFFIFPFNLAWVISIILPPIFASLFMFAFLRHLKTSRAAAILGALTLAFSGFFVSWLTWGTLITSAMWLPLILLCINKTFEKIRAIWFLILVFAFSQTIFSGHFQTAFYVFFAGILYLFYQYFHFKKLAPLLYILGSILLGILLASVQLLPFFELLSLSARSADQGYFLGRKDWFFPLSNFVQLIAPDYFGNPTTYNYRGIWNYAEFVSFIGIIPLGFAILALIKKAKKIWFFLILAALSIILAVENPISKIPYIFNISLLSSAQPSRIIFLLVFSLSALASFGYDAFFQEKRKQVLFIPGLILLLAVVILAIFAIGIPNIDYSRIALRNLIFPGSTVIFFLLIIFSKSINIPRSAIFVLVFGFALVELFRFAYKFTPFTKLSLIFPGTETTNFLSTQQRPFRIMTTDRRILAPNTAGVYEIESVEGYDPLYLKDYAQLVTAWESGNVVEPGSFGRIITPHKYDSKIADFLNVKYIVSFDEIKNDNFIKVHEEGATKIFANKNALPRAFFASEVIKVASYEDQLKKMLDPDLDLSKTALSTTMRFSKQKVISSVDFQLYQDQQLKIQTSTDYEAPLIVSNVFYPGWKAYVDGNETEINRVNFMFQGILVPEGKHEVEFQFRPKSFYNGFYISTASVIGTLLVAFYIWRRKYQ